MFHDIVCHKSQNIVTCVFHLVPKNMEQYVIVLGGAVTLENNLKI